MAISITSTPTYPIVGEEVTLALTGHAYNAAEFELLSKPATSALEVNAILRGPDGSPGATFTPDVQGAYLFRGYDVWAPSGSAGQYADDPSGSARRQVRDSGTATINVAASLELPIVTTLGHSAVLRLRVHGGTVRAAEIVAPSTEVARLAALQPAVVAALAALVGLAAQIGTLGENFITDVPDFLAKFANHLGTGVPVHATADTTNVPTRESATSVVAALAALNELHDRLLGHLMAGTGGGTWHGTDDTENLPVTPKAVDFASGVVLLVDLRERVYERHRISATAVHSEPDAATASKMSDPLPHTVAIVAYLDALVALIPTAPSGEQQGVTNALHGFGYRLVA